MKIIIQLLTVMLFVLVLPGFALAQNDPAVSDQNNIPKADALIELEVEGVYEYESGASSLVRLTEKEGNGSWCLIMVVGSCEANALVRNMDDVEYSRPLTYDLMSHLFSETSLALKHVVITKLEDGTFYAVLVIDDNGKTIEIDARPSDSINIALKVGVPIFGTREVWEESKEKMP